MRLIFSTIIVGICLAACTGSTGVKEGSKTSDMPEWVRKEGNYDGKGIGAIGSAAFDESGTQIQRYEAKTAARAELCQIIEARIQISISTTNTRLKQVGLSSGQSVSALQTQAVGSALCDKAIKSSRSIETWRDPANKEFVIWVVIDNEHLNDELINEITDAVIQKKLDEAS
ncbi:uncharacterized protein METZ01_LOCUS411118, partial [marine metagenome]